MEQQQPISRGLRVKQARLMAGFTRKAFEENFGINVNTLQAWESGKSSLTLKGATRVVHALDKVGVSCHIEWLLFGKGNPPEFNLETIPKPQNQPFNSETQDLIHWNDEIAILKEVDLFSKHNPNPMVMVISDDAMEIQYSIGDYVGGRKRTQNNYDDWIGNHCIIETTENLILCRRLERGSEQNRYHLASINPCTTVSHPILFNIEIKNLAPIIWHRKRDY